MEIWMWLVIIVVAAGGFYLWKQVQAGMEAAEEIVQSGSLVKDADANMAYSLGVGAAKQGNDAEAIQAFRRADELGHEGATHNLGLLLERTGKLDEARKVFERSVERGFIPHAGNLAVILQKQGDYQEALKMVQMAKDAGVGDPNGIMATLETDIRAAIEKRGGAATPAG